MAWQQTPYTMWLLLSGIIATALAILAWRFRERPGSVSFMLLMLAIADWSFAYAVVIARSDPTSKLFFTKVMYIGVVLVPIAWLLFVLEYTGRTVRVTRRNLFLASVIGTTGRKNYLTRRNLVALVAIPLVTLSLVWTNGAHGLMWQEVSLDSVQGTFNVLTMNFGPWFWVHMAYSYLLIIIGILLLVQVLIRSRHIYRGQTSALLVGAAIPWAANASYIAGVQPFPGLDPTILGFTVTGILFFGALFRYRLLDVIPVAREVARDEVIENMDDGVVVYDGRDRIVDLNPMAERLVSNGAEAIGKPLDEGLPTIADVIQPERGPEPTEVALEVAGEQRVFDIQTSRLFQGLDHLSGGLVILRDITDRKRTEERFQALIEHSSDIVTVIDDEARIQYQSPSIESILGYDAEELLDERLFDYIHPDDRQAVREIFSEMDAGTGRIEYRFRHADGSWQWLETVGRRRSASHADEGYVFNSRDVTERRQYEQRLQVLNRVVRHDLRNDVNVILAHADELLDRVSEEEEEITRSILGKGLEVAELSTKAKQIEQTFEDTEESRQPIDLVEVVEDRLDAVEQAHPNVETDARLPDQALVKVSGLIDSAVDNILGNAIEHNDQPTPHVQVSIKAEDSDNGYVDLTVLDDGPGLPETEQAVLESGTETPLEHSSGLGLWLINWIVTESGGEIKIDHNEPRGTAVTIRLPQASAETVTGPPAEL